MRIRFGRTGWGALLLVAALLLGLYTIVQRPSAEPYTWEVPVPPAPDMTLFERGDPTLRPVIHSVQISNYGVQNGWLVVPWNRFLVAVEAERADQVTVHGWSSLDGEELDPDGSWLGRLRREEGNPNRWMQRLLSPGGRNLAIYVTAENAHGRTVSPVTFVAWCARCPYSADQVRHPE